MRTDPFYQELPVQLTEDERNVRGRQAARLEVALQKHLVDAKEAKKKLADREKELEEGILKAARAADSGEEPRQVECREVLRGVVVEVIRCDTNETIDSRPATGEELGSAPARSRAKKPASKLASKGDDGIDDDYPATH